MPYRRLPNTDQARIRALKMAIEKGDTYNVSSLPISLKAIYDAKNFLSRFERAHEYYKQCLSNQVSSNKKYQANVKMARLYVSHFVQVLNLAIIRSEIKGEFKDLYGLPHDTNNVPDLISEASILEWGDKIIKGEEERLRYGGVPIYNPTVAKVRVHYNIFKDGYEVQKNLQNITNKSLEKLSAMRNDADVLILDLWNQIEKKFETLSGEERLNKCREYGVVYYYRTGEKRPPAGVV